MVYACIVHTLHSRIHENSALYYKVFGNECGGQSIVKPTDGFSEGNTTDKTPRDFVQACVEEVRSQYAFRCQVAGRSYEQDMFRLQNEGSIPDTESGFFTLSASDKACRDYISHNKVVVWMGLLDCGFTLVCERHENRTQAENTLKILIKQLQEHCRIFQKPAELTALSYKVDMLVSQLLPGGALLFYNHRALRQLEKETETKMKTLTA